ncbi:MAG TPA: cyclic nucleotide-binding domain-containing protein [Kiritimatiellia bacterium]|nr:cyclic nucleotide-binding domain-containing protein [Kiritimatiellia bacterium]
MHIRDFIKDHPLFKGIDAGATDWLVSCALAREYEAGDFILRVGKPADHLYLIAKGRVSIEAPPAGDKGAIIIQTLADGDTVGWSWMLPPYTWNLDARAMARTVAIAIDAAKLRERLETDTALAAKLYRRFSEVMLQRIHGMRKQLYESA